MHAPEPATVETVTSLALRLAAAERALAARDKTIQALVTREKDRTAKRPSTFGAMEDNAALQQVVARKTMELEAQNHKLEQTTNALRETSSLLEVLMENTPTYIYFKDKQSRFVRFSKSLQNSFGQSDDDALKGKTDFDFLAESCARESFADEQAILRTGEPMIGKPEKLKHADGRDLWTLTTKMPWRDKDGSLIGTFGISADLTAIKTAEAELEAAHKQLVATSRLAGETNARLQHEVVERERAQAFLNSVVENLPIAVFIKEAKELRFILWNKAGEKLTGISNAEMIGKSDHDFFPPKDAELYVASDRATFEKRAVLEIPEEVMQTRNHGARTVRVWKVPIFDAAGLPAFLLGIADDITERKRTQAELEETHRQLVDASRRGGMAEIATNVLHNVGNVLNSVNVSTGLIVASVKKSKVSQLARVVALLQAHPQDLGEFITADPKGKHVPVFLAQLAENLQAEQAAMVGELDSLRRNVEHIKEIVAMQQNYARVGGVKEMINVTDLVAESLRMNEGAMSRHGVEVIREFEKVPPLNVEKHKILQIMVNLLRNAKHACQDSGRDDRKLTVHVANSGGAIKISVADNGVGIPPENLTRIFNHGFTTRKEGHGFGLHSAALAAKEMGGSLTVTSDGPGQGATFILELPCQPPENSHE